ncbi:MAG TPA: methyltransferase domain-containing protein [Bryobacteraceae bacterium]|nr:methyltransferase domain-containing protein [Bryobacteraceae bacterium]
MVEFTGERVIPGQVDDDLWSEHVARYAFARRYAPGKRVLDAGCGTGYGSAELAQSGAEVVGVDVAPEAIEYARGSYPIPGLRFVESSCTSVPFPPESFDLLVAFEVIEHLADYRAFIDECGRVLTRDGLFIVSSPNKRYYAETRAATGPNPYHEHEFEPAEFVGELERVFGNVRLMLQNRVESFAFHPASSFWPAEARIDGGGGNADDAHFLIALCSRGPLPEPKSFVYVPKAANLLRERELYVEALKKQLADVKANRQALLEAHRRQTRELEERNEWAKRLDGELTAAGETIAALQNEAAEQARAYQAQFDHMDRENQAKTDWAQKASAELEAKCQELAHCVELLETAEATVRERTVWGQAAEATRQQLAAQLEMVRTSRWVKLGRKAGLGPEV